MSQWVRHWSRMRAISSNRWLLLGKATSILLLVKLGLRVLPFSQFRKAYAYILNKTAPGHCSAQYVSDVAWAVRAVAYRLPFDLTCLPQALTVKYLLRRASDLPLHIGVQTLASQGFQAHAWIEKDGRIIIGEWPQENSYRPIWVWQ